MSNLLKKIYDLTYSPIITPFDLVENALIDNYKYVKYYKTDNYFVTEMKFVSDNSEETFFYCFEDVYYLKKIYLDSMDEKNCVFNRTTQLEIARKQFIDKNIIIKNVISF